MRLLHTSIHPDISDLNSQSILLRPSARAINLQGSDILMLYTQVYHDYSLPGGGLNTNEDPMQGVVRELSEETGAQNIRDIKPFGIYEEYRPWYKPDFDIQHIVSYCYICTSDKELGPTNYEDYEIKNGMKPLWINIYEAIEHNQKIIENSHQKGLSIERETFLLKLIVKELVQA